MFNEGWALGVILWKCCKSSFPTLMQGIFAAILSLPMVPRLVRANGDSRFWYPIVSQIVIKALVDADNKLVFGRCYLLLRDSLVIMLRDS